MGEYDKAVSCLKRILRCNPNHWRAKLFLRDALASKDMYYDEDKARRIAKRNAVLDISVSDFELSVRARNCLKKMNIHTLGDLVRTTEAELLTYKNFGETSLKEIKDMLAAKSLTLGQALEEDGDLSGFSSAGVVEEDGAKQEVGIRAIAIDKLDLSIRAQRVLENLNIRTLGQLADRTEAELTCQKNFGKTSLQEVKDALSQYGLGLRTVK
jgi:DNA-directed RNA polymerase subunit alpha